MSRVSDALRQLDEWIKAGRPEIKLDTSRGHPCRHGPDFFVMKDGRTLADVLAEEEKLKDLKKQE